MALIDKLTAIANAIRGKTGKTEELTLDQMAAEITGISTGVNTSDATATAADILSGKTAYVDGEKVTGTIVQRTASSLTASGRTVTAPAGYYAEPVSKDVSFMTLPKPSISVDSSGLITAKIKPNTAGWINATEKSDTKQLTTQAAQTITPSTADKTIASGKYLTGAQTIKGDANLIAENIKSGVSIFGVAGSYEGSGGSGGGKTVTIRSEMMDAKLIYFKEDGSLDYLVSESSCEAVGGVLLLEDTDYDLDCNSEFYYYSGASCKLYYLPNGGTVSVW